MSMTFKTAVLSLFLALVGNGQVVFSQAAPGVSPAAQVAMNEQLKRLRGELQSKNADTVRSALEELLPLRENAASLLPEIVALLGNTDYPTPRQRISGVDFTLGELASFSLAEIGAQAIPFLAEVVRKKDVTAQLNALEALARIENKAVAPVLLMALEDPTEEVRKRAAGSLRPSWSGNPEFALPPFLLSLQSKNPFVRRVVLSILPITLPASKEEEKGRADAVFRALTDEDVAVRAQAVTLVVNSRGWLRDTRAIEPLAAALNSPDATLRETAAYTLASYGDERTIQPLIGLLDSKDGNARSQSAYWLGELKARVAVDPLIKRLEVEKQLWLREAVAQALAEIGDSKAVEPLRRAAQKDRGTRVVYAFEKLSGTYLPPVTAPK